MVPFHPDSQNSLNVLQSNLSVSKATDPGSTSCEKVRFLINADILYEIVVFGLADKDAKVTKVYKNILLYTVSNVDLSWFKANIFDGSDQAAK